MHIRERLHDLEEDIRKSVHDYSIFKGLIKLIVNVSVRGVEFSCHKVIKINVKGHKTPLFPP